MTLAVIQPVDWIPVAFCELCGQSMPADHRTHITETAPVAAGADDTEGNDS